MIKTIEVGAIDFGDNRNPLECCDHIIERDGRPTLGSRVISLGNKRNIALCQRCVALFEVSLLRELIKDGVSHLAPDDLKRIIET